MANGVGRLSSAAVLGLLFYAAGMMGGVAIGLLLAIGIAAWHGQTLADRATSLRSARLNPRGRAANAGFGSIPISLHRRYHVRKNLF